MSDLAPSSLALRILPVGLLVGPRSGLRGSWYLIERHARAYRNGWPMLVSGFFEPLFYLLSIGIGISKLVGTVVGPGGQVISYTSFVAPAMMATSAMNGAVIDTTFGVFFLMKYSKVFDAVLATPMQSTDVAKGQLGWAVIRGGLYSVSFMIVMLAMGLVHSAWAILDVPASLVVSIGFAGAGLAATTFMRSWQHFEYVTLAILPMFLFSATFYPLYVYPRALQFVVEATPLYQGVALLRGLTSGYVGPGLLWSVAYLVLMGSAGLFVASRRITKLLLK